MDIRISLATGIYRKSGGTSAWLKVFAPLAVLFGGDAPATAAELGSGALGSAVLSSWAEGTAVPHFEQNLSLALIAMPHCAQNIVDSPFCDQST